MGRLISLGGFVLRKVHGTLAGCAQLGVRGSGGMNAIPRADLLSTSLAVAVFLLVPMLALLAISVALAPHTVTAGTLLAFPVLTTPKRKSGSEPQKPANIRAMEGNLKSLLTELDQIQIEMQAGPLSQERGEEVEAKAHEAEELQAHIDRYNYVSGTASKIRDVKQVTLPSDSAHDISRKTLYTTPGHMFVLSDALERYRQQGKEGWSAKVNIGRRFGKKMQLRGEDAVKFEQKAFNSADLPELGTDAIIAVDRDPEIVRFEEPEILTIRDVLNSTTTTSDAIRFVKHTQTTRAAQSQATRGALKTMLRVEFEPETTNVQTIAVLSKVTEQDIDDAPRLVGYINGEMSLDVRQEEERQIVWGDGTGGTLVGLFDDSIGIPEFQRAEVGDTVIDTIRKMRTDLRKRRVTPNFVTIDPLDWEEIELAKGSDERYVWGLITDLRGPRIWSLRVVESDAMTNAETNERRILVGDGVRGATIYDRTSIQLAVGFMDDDFGRNLRTLRAEERLALAVKRSFAFEYAITASPES
jgi:HK97 family phage major capsid protein